MQSGAKSVKIFGVILAGGEGTRMGGVDKALLPLAGQPLLAHVSARFMPQVADLALSANGDATRFAGFGLPVLPDDRAQGPLSGVLAALEWAAATGADAVATVAVDTPFFPCDLVPRLWLAGDGGAAIASSGGRLHPTFALWPIGARHDLRAWLAAGEARLMGFARAQNAAEAGFAMTTPDPFYNINTRADLAQAETWL